MKRNIFAVVTFFILVFFDQLTKYLAVINLKGKSGVSVIPDIFRFFYLENHGAAFGILQHRQIFLLLISFIILCVIGYLFYHIPDNRRYIPACAALILVCSGATGNMIDRIRNGFVIDFLYFEWINFPIFNVADCYVVIAAMLLLFLFFFYYREDEMETLFSLRRRKETEHDESDV